MIITMQPLARSELPAHAELALASSEVTPRSFFCVATIPIGLGNTPSYLTYEDPVDAEMAVHSLIMDIDYLDEMYTIIWLGDQNENHRHQQA